MLGLRNWPPLSPVHNFLKEDIFWLRRHHIDCPIFIPIDRKVSLVHGYILNGICVFELDHAHIVLDLLVSEVLESLPTISSL